VGDIIMPVIGAVTGGLDFSNHFIPLSKSVTSPVLSEAKKQGAVIGWGNFLRAALEGATAPRLPSFRDTLRRVVDLFSSNRLSSGLLDGLAQYSNVTAEPGRVLHRSVVG
jgi:hypothetical protein